MEGSQVPLVEILVALPKEEDEIQKYVLIVVN
jgi:hypothetical protein